MEFYLDGNKTAARIQTLYCGSINRFKSSKTLIDIRWLLMKKMIYLLFLLFLMNGVLSAQQVKIENLNWIIPSGHGSVKTADGVIECNFSSPDGKTPEGGFWQVGQLVNELSLNGYRYLNLTAKSADAKNHLVYIYVHRRLAPGNEADFYSIIEITPKWQTYHLQLQQGDLSQAGSGLFAFAKGTTNCDIELSKGGQLLHFSPAVGESTVIEFKDINLTAENSLDPAVQKVKDMVLKHPKFTPYAFKTVIKENAVKLEGFTILISKNASQQSGAV